MIEKDRWDEINSLTQEQARAYKWKFFELTPEQQEAVGYKACPPPRIETHSIGDRPVSKEEFDANLAKDTD